MRQEDIQLLYNYNCWANQRLLDKATDLSPEQFVQPTTFSFGTLKATLTHIMDSEYVWRTLCQNNRFEGRLVDKADFPTLTSINTYWAAEQQRMRAFMAGLADSDVDGIVHYEAEGRVVERVLWHCLLHMINHGTQHRSQCAAMLKDLGHPVGSLDLTHFLNLQAAATS
jgi:uncharacterized damage-inducible protein DinB